MKITIKAGEIEFTVEHDAQEPHPKDQWYGVNMLSFTNSIQGCMKEATDQIVTIQKELYNGRKDKIETAVTAKNNVA